jgi:hypothetical protein
MTIEQTHTWKNISNDLRMCCHCGIEEQNGKLEINLSCDDFMLQEILSGGTGYREHVKKTRCNCCGSHEYVTGTKCFYCGNVA